MDILVAEMSHMVQGEGEPERGWRERAKIKQTNISILCPLCVCVCVMSASAEIIFRVTLYRVLSFMGNCVFIQKLELIAFANGLTEIQSKFLLDNSLWSEIEWWDPVILCDHAEQNVLLKT